MKKTTLFIILTIFFSFLLIILENYFFGSFKEEIIKEIENDFIDKSIYSELESDKYLNGGTENNSLLLELTLDKNKAELKSAYNVGFIYIPSTFKKESLDYSNNFKILVTSKEFIDFIEGLNIELHKNKFDVRGKMQDKKVKLFGIKKMEKGEFISVGIHEIAHYIDLYFLEKKVLTDLSNYFYNISWRSTKILKAGMKQEDFVSGYAMTNKYEDFAESLTYYVLHNNDFKNKSLKSSLLKEKYVFFQKYLFRNSELEGSDFSNNLKIESYYRDITKIDFSLQNFLEFLKK